MRKAVSYGRENKQKNNNKKQKTAEVKEGEFFPFPLFTHRTSRVYVVAEPQNVPPALYLRKMERKGRAVADFFELPQGKKC